MSEEDLLKIWNLAVAEVVGNQDEYTIEDAKLVGRFKRWVEGGEAQDE